MVRATTLRRRPASPAERRRRSAAAESASALALVPALLLVFLCLGGIAIDLSLVHGAHRGAHRTLSSAADDAAAMIDTSELQLSGELRIDPGDAERVVLAHLRLADLPGTDGGDPNDRGRCRRRRRDGAGRPRCRPCHVASAARSPRPPADPGRGERSAEPMSSQSSAPLGAHTQVRVRRIRVAGRRLVAKSATGRRRSELRREAELLGHLEHQQRHRAGGAARVGRPHRHDHRRCR